MDKIPSSVRAQKERQIRPRRHTRAKLAELLPLQGPIRQPFLHGVRDPRSESLAGLEKLRLQGITSAPSKRNRQAGVDGAGLPQQNMQGHTH